MSREERKMAQIIASIERMEQRKAAPASATRADATGESTDDVGAGSGPNSSGAPAGTAESPAAIERAHSGEIHAQVQKATRLGAKGRRLKPLSTSHGAKVKAAGGSKGAKTPPELVVRKTPLVDCRLTPKKRWIQLWNEQQSSSGEAGGSTGESSTESTAVPSQDKAVLKPPSSVASAKTPVAAVPLPTVRPTIVREEGEEEEGEAEEEDPALEDGEAAEDSDAKVAIQADALLSSPSPQTDEQKETSISPVSSVKESLKETPAALAPQKKIDERAVSMDDTKLTATTPALESQPVSVATKADDPVPAAATTTTTTAASGGVDDTRNPSGKKPVAETASKGPAAQMGGDTGDRSRKRSLERKDSEPLTEEERRRAERRRLRKSNWDVGDPRFASRNGEKQAVRSPMSDDLTPSSKFPTGRPAWRHSNSMDATYSSKSSFPASNSLHRSSFNGGSGGNSAGGGGPSRRPFYSSNSLPLDRSRSAGRSSSGHHHSSSYR